MKVKNFSNIVIVLGSPNDDEGNLSIIAQDRLNCVYDFLNMNTNFSVICTGGFGEHFNNTDKPHSYYAKKFLIEKGVSTSLFLECPPTANTVEDFVKTKDIIYENNPNILVIITSDFHMERAKLLCENIIDYNNVIFISAKSTLNQMALTPLIQHEKKSIEHLIKFGIQL